MEAARQEPAAHPLERFVAVLAAILCVSLFVLLWRSLVSYQPVWPLPGLYFLEMAILGALGAYVFLPGRAHLTAVSWGAAGAILAFAILGAFSVGALYLPAALILAITSLTYDLRNKQPLPAHLGAFLLAGLAQAALILAVASSPAPVIGPETAPAVKATDAATLAAAPTATEPVPSPTPGAEGGLLPTLEAGSIRGRLSSAFSVQDLHGVGSPGIRKVGGWDYGYRGNGCAGFRWLDDDHLLLYPSVGQVHFGEGGRVEDLSPQPVVINLETGHVWLPETSETTRPGKCDSVYWSRALGLLIQPLDGADQSSLEGGAVITSTVEGKQTGNFPGRLLGVSPSGTKMMIGPSTLIDLGNDRSFEFGWEIDEQSIAAPKVFWSPDEKRVYRCCYFYGDTGSGKGFDFDPGDFQGNGRRPEPGTVHSLGRWVLGGKSFLIEWDVVDDGYADIFPLFDPLTKRYDELEQAASIPEEWTCVEISVSPDGTHAWISCWEGSYLVDLATSAATAYPNNVPVEISWSADGRYASLILRDDTLLILSVARRQAMPLPGDPSPGHVPSWHPVDATFALLRQDGRAAEFVSAVDMSSRTLELPAAFASVLWSPSGERLALLAEDGSVWQTEYPALEKPERISPPMPGMGDIAWSPDGSLIAFVRGANIYVVEARR